MTTSYQGNLIGRANSERIEAVSSESELKYRVTLSAAFIGEKSALTIDSSICNHNCDGNLLASSRQMLDEHCIKINNPQHSDIDLCHSRSIDISNKSMLVPSIDLLKQSPLSEQ
jgi:hypothetical protein